MQQIHKALDSQGSQGRFPLPSPITVFDRGQWRMGDRPMRNSGSEHFHKATLYPCLFTAPDYKANAACQPPPYSKAQRKSLIHALSKSHTLWASSGPIFLLFQQRQAPPGATPTPRCKAKCGASPSLTWLGSEVG